MKEKFKLIIGNGSKKIWLTIITFLILSSALQARLFSGGSGTLNNPYQISSTTDLLFLSCVDSIGADTLWKKHYVVINDIQFGSDKTKVDWNNDGFSNWDVKDQKGFSPIGDGLSGQRQKVNFTGTFNGKGHYVSNLYIYRNENYIGLFGLLGPGSVVDSLGVVNATIYSDGGWIYGVLAGKADGLKSVTKAVIKNSCVIGGSITIKDEVDLGGLIGYANCVDVLNCYSTVTINGSCSIGGLIGSMDFDINLQNCYASGRINRTLEGFYTGGMVSDCFGYTALIKNCFWDIETTNQIIPGFSVESGAKGLNTTAFSNQDNFTLVGWNFSDIWQMGALPDDNYIRPRLKWQALSEIENLCPIDFKAIKKSSVSADLIWSCSAQNYNLVYGVAGSISNPSNETSIRINGLSYSLQNITDNKTYDVFIQADYGNGNVSSWSKYSFCLYTNEGSGTYKFPYQVESSRDLVALSQNPILWSNCFIQTADIDFGKDETIVDWNGDLVINNEDKKGFAPIGRIDPFTGRYNGNGHKIKNLFISNNDQLYVGLFGSLNSGAIVENIGLEDVDITATHSKTMKTFDYSVTTFADAGSIAGYSNYSTIRNSYANGTIKSISNAGGLSGVAYIVNISNSYSSVNTTSDYGGGIYGWGYSQDNLTNCYSTGKIMKVKKDTYLAGLIGTYSNSLVFKSCYWDTVTSGRSYATNYGNKPANLESRGLKSSDFSNPSNFTNWDFTNIWYISKDVPFDSIARPRLQWQKGSSKLTGTIFDLNGVTVNLIDQETGQQISKTTVDNEYSFSIKYNQSVIIKPIKEGYTFIPDSILLNNVTTSKNDLNFNALYHIYYKKNNGGVLEGDTIQTVEYNNNSKAVTAIPNPGYQFLKWQNHNGDSLSNSNPLILENVACDSSITAIFEVNILDVQNENVTISSEEGSSASVLIVSNLKWKTETDATWFSINFNSGSGSKLITFIANANTSVFPRRATVAVSADGISSQIITVIQEGANTSAIFTVAPSLIIIDPHEGSSATMLMAAKLPWKVQKSDSWFTITPQSGIGYDTIVFTAKANLSEFDKPGIATFTSTDSNSLSVNVIQLAGNGNINNQIINQELVLFPNPITDYFQLRGIQGKTVIAINDLNGRVILRKNIDHDETIPVNGLKKGIYFIRINNHEGIIVKKLIKE
jgi:hypothetical protein